MIDCCDKFSKRLLICTMNLGMFMGLTGYALAESAPTPGKVAMLRFDAIVELNAPLCRTHVVLFARYWVSPEVYRAAVVWAEPHAGSLNFPIYPPTLNVVSDREAFRVEHQFKHMYDGVFPRPLGQRGAFLHKFNSYHFSDIRFAEQEALNLRIQASDIQPLKKADGPDGERVFKVSAPRASGEPKQYLAKLSFHTTKGRLDELRLLDAEGGLLQSVEYEYTNQKDKKSQLHRQNVLLPQRPITVGFKGKGPTITIAGEKRRYSELEATHHQGGRKCMVDYQPMEIGGRRVPLPVRITVYRADAKLVLRSARLYNFTHCELSADDVKKSAEQFSFFDRNEIKCRELLLKYWVKEPADVAQADRKTLEQLRTHFADKFVAGLTIGEQLRHVNVLLQLDWMLGHTAGLERDFQRYVYLLAVNDLDRMVLVGGQHAIEMTIRWGQIDVADKLLDTWLGVSVPRNDVESALNFANDSVRKKRFWTIVKLMDKVLEKSQLSASQRFVAQALRCMGLAQVYEMVKDPDRIKTELGIAQAWWVSSQMSTESLRRNLSQGMFEAKQFFAGLDRPTRQYKALKAKLEKVHLDTLNAEDE